MLAAYSERREEWFWASRKKKGARWLVRKWKKGDWSKDGDFDTATFNAVVLKAEAQRMLTAFVATSVCVEYNGCDSARINTWFSDAKRDPLPFFDLGRGICFSTHGKAIFGYKEPISRSVFAKLQTITDDLFVLNGRSCSQPVVASSSSSSSASSPFTAPPLLIRPHITECDVADVDIKDSDEVLDCQRLMNLLVVLRTVYHS